MSDDPILAALARLEAGQAALRVDLMERMDRLQHRLNDLDEHLTIGDRARQGNTDHVERRSDGIAEQNRLFAEQMTAMQKLLHQLEGDRK